MKGFFAFCLLLNVFLLSACSSTGDMGNYAGNSSAQENKFSEGYVRAHVIAGKTTRSEVQAIYGQPDSQVTSASGRRYCIYKKQRQDKSLYPGQGTVKNISSAMGSVGNLISGTKAAQAISDSRYAVVRVNHEASNANNLANTVSGDKDVNNSENFSDLKIHFDENDVVSDWSM